jgi:hypothetical protein
MFGRGLQIEWNAEDFFKDKRFFWKKVRRVVLDAATGMPVEATFVDKAGDLTDELKVTEIKTYVSKTGKRLTLPSAVEFCMNVKDGDDGCAVVFYWKTTDVKLGELHDEREFHPDPRQYGLTKILDRSTNRTFTLPDTPPER